MNIPIIATINQNEVTCNQDFNFKISLFNESDNSDYLPYSATVKFIDRDGTVILDTIDANVDENDVEYVLDKSLIEEPALYNVAVVTVTDNEKTFTLSFIFHIVTQIIVNPLKESDITDRYEILDKHKNAFQNGFYKKIADAFAQVKNDLMDKNGLQYALGLIDNTQIKELVLLKTIIYICRDLAAAQGSDGYIWGLLEETKQEYSGKLNTAFFIYDSTVEESYPDTTREVSVRCYR